MEFEVSLEWRYSQPIEEVWRGLTEARAISEWLMQTDDFVPEPGHRFTMYCVDSNGHRDEYRCQVLELNSPEYMRWSWVLAGNEDLGLTEVEFRLTSTDTGTRLVLKHMGDRDKEMLERFKSGWPYKLELLGDLLNSND